MCIAPLCAQGCVAFSLAHKQAKHCPNNVGLLAKDTCWPLFRKP